MGVQTRGLPVTALVPVSLRRAHEAQALGNRISAMLVPLTVEASEEEERFAATCAITRELKQRAAWVGMDTLCGWLDRLPAPLVPVPSMIVDSTIAGSAGSVLLNVIALCLNLINSLYVPGATTHSSPSVAALMHP